MSSRPQASEASTGFREVVTAWVFAGVMLVTLALLPSHDADAPAESLAAATAVAHAHPIHAMPAHNEDRDLLGACDFDARDAEPAMQRCLCASD